MSAILHSQFYYIYGDFSSRSIEHIVEVGCKSNVEQFAASPFKVLFHRKNKRLKNLRRKSLYSLYDIYCLKLS